VLIEQAREHRTGHGHAESARNYWTFEQKSRRPIGSTADVEIIGAVDCEW